MEDAEVLMCVGILNAEAVAAQHSVVQSSAHSGVVECMISRTRALTLGKILLLISHLLGTGRHAETNMRGAHARRVVY